MNSSPHPTKIYKTILYVVGQMRLQQSWEWKQSCTTELYSKEFPVVVMVHKLGLCSSFDWVKVMLNAIFIRSGERGYNSLHFYNVFLWWVISAHLFNYDYHTMRKEIIGAVAYWIAESYSRSVSFIFRSSVFSTLRPMTIDMLANRQRRIGQLLVSGHTLLRE